MIDHQSVSEKENYQRSLFVDHLGYTAIIPRNLSNKELLFKSFIINKKVLEDPPHQAWWESLRQSPNSRPPDVPRQIKVRLNQ